MNLVGKVFTITIFLMSLIFMTVSLMVYSSATSHKPWKKVVDDYSKDLDAEKKKNSELLKEQKGLEDQLKHEIDMAQARLVALENQYVSLRKERDANDKLVRDKEDQINALAASVRDSHSNLENLRGIAKNLQEQIKTTLASRDDSFQKVLTRTDEFHNLIAELERLQKQNRILLDEIQQMENSSAASR